LGSDDENKITLMNSHTIKFGNCLAEVSVFEPDGGVAEYNLMLHAVEYGSFEEQLESLHVALRHILGSAPLNTATPVLKRYFIGNADGAEDILSSALSCFPACAVSIIKQPPLDGSLVALWLYAQSDVRLECVNPVSFTHNGYIHIWNTGAFSSEPTVSAQTKRVFEEYDRLLNGLSCSIKDNCVRTWVYVENIDDNYKEFAKSRKEYFWGIGLTERSHYVASTGIEGSGRQKGSSVVLDSYALKGAEKGQVRYLYAISHLNPTYEYGVTFERGVYVQYGDRRQIFISGTASIDNSGNVLHIGDIKGQTLRMWENVRALLSEAGAGFDDISQIIVYLRSAEDYSIVSQMFDERFPKTPLEITLAPVCRPDWLIEMECMALTTHGDKNFRDF